MYGGGYPVRRGPAAGGVGRGRNATLPAWMTSGSATPATTKSTATPSTVPSGGGETTTKTALPPNWQQVTDASSGQVMQTGTTCTLCLLYL